MAITISGTTMTMNDGSTITSPTSLNSIGSFIRAANIQSSQVWPGQTIAGTSLIYPTGSSPYGTTIQDGRYAVAIGNYGASTVDTIGAYPPDTSGTSSLSGTWRALSANFGITSLNYQEGNYFRGFGAGIYVRTS